MTRPRVDTPSTTLGSPRGDVASDSAAMFELAPVSLWLEDYTGVRRQLDAWRAEGVEDLRGFLNADHARVSACASLIRVVDVNKRTLDLFEAPDRIRLLAGLDRIFRDDMFEAHVEELVQLWEGRTNFRSQTVNYTLGGRRLDILLDGTVLPGSEDDWGRVLVALDDITERESARRAREESEAHARGLFDHSPVSLWGGKHQMEH